MVEFSSWDRGVENSGRPRTGEFGAFLAEISEGALKFRDLDVLGEEDLCPGGQKRRPQRRRPSQPVVPRLEFLDADDVEVPEDWRPIAQRGQSRRECRRRREARIRHRIVI